MRIMYIASMFEDADLEDIFTNLANVSYAANKYNILLCEGLAQNEADVNVLSLLPVTRNNCSKIWIRKKTKKDERLTIKYPITINIPGLKHFLRCVDVFFRVLFARSDTVILFDLYAIAANIGMNFAAKLRNIRKVCILTDLPEHLSSPKWVYKAEKKIISDATAYILLTEQMNERVNPHHKPVIVLEGHIDYSLIKSYSKGNNGLLNNSHERIIMYAGALHKRYGIANLIEAFIRCHRQNEVLYVYGAGDYVERIREIAQVNSCIRYCGVKPNSEIVCAEMEADLLVNPRTADGEYTRYSFPSKVLEYMASGTPVLMARLPGIPDEYYRYVYTFDDRSSVGLENALRYVLDEDIGEIYQMGRKAQEFVFAKKSNIIQARKIVEWLQQN